MLNIRTITPTAKGMWVPPLEHLRHWRTGAVPAAGPPVAQALVLPRALRVVCTELACVAVREHGGDPRRSPARSWDALPEEASQDENDSSSPPRLASRHGRTMLQ